MNRLQFLQTLFGTGLTAGLNNPTHATAQELPRSQPSPLPAAVSIPAWLAEWQADQINPITQANDDPELLLLLRHQQHQMPIEILYQGGSWPHNQPRTVTPILLFEKIHYPAIYLLAWCHERKAARTFQLDKISKLGKTLGL